MADPVTLAAIGLGISGAGAAASTFLGGSKAPNIQAPQQAPPVQAPTGSASTYKANQPSFLSAAAASPQQQNVAQKSLLGQ